MVTVMMFTFYITTSTILIDTNNTINQIIDLQQPVIERIRMNMTTESIEKTNDTYINTTQFRNNFEKWKG
jgi:hypothetical protein